MCYRSSYLGLDGFYLFVLKQHPNFFPAQFQSQSSKYSRNWYLQALSLIHPISFGLPTKGLLKKLPNSTLRGSEQVLVFWLDNNYKYIAISYWGGPQWGKTANITNIVQWSVDILQLFFENQLDLTIELTLREHNQFHRCALSFDRCTSPVKLPALHTINNTFPLDWLNLSFDTDKVNCKKILLI